MIRKTFLALALALSQQAAMASDWLVFPSGATVTTQQWSGNTAPVVGTNVPAGSTVVLWTQQNGDIHPDHYTLSNGALTYTPPPPPPPLPPAPDPNGLAAALSSQITSPVTRLQLAAFMGVAQAYNANPALVKQAWSDLVAVQGIQNNPSGWLDSATQNLVLSLASQYNMPLQ